MDLSDLFINRNSSKPEISPPLILTELDLEELNKLAEKYEPLIMSKSEPFWRPRPPWIQYADAIDDVLFLNFASISYFMENEVYKQVDKSVHEETVKDLTTLAASCGWIIGHEWRSLDLIKEYENNNFLTVDDIPPKALKTLLKAIYPPYYLFASIFTKYYESDYGKRT